MNIRKICMNCMREKLDENGKCVACGKNESEIICHPNHLPMRTILNGRYLIGRATGEGSLGIVYIAYDLALQISVAIKEFFPAQYVRRDENDELTVLLCDEEKRETFEKEEEKFIGEAREEARNYNERDGVSILDLFRENDTVYIVMDCVKAQEERISSQSAPQPEKVTPPKEMSDETQEEILEEVHVAKTSVKSEKPKKSNMVKLVFGLAALILAMAFLIGYSNYYKNNRTYKEKQEDGGYMIITVEDGVIVKQEKYDSSGRLLVCGTYPKGKDTEILKYYDESGNLSSDVYIYEGSEIARTDYYDDGKTIQTTFESENTYTSTMYQAGENIVQKWNVIDGETEEAYFAEDYPAEGWTSYNKYIMGDNSDDSYQKDYYDPNNNLVLSVVVENGEQVEVNIVNQELYDSVTWRKE
ncbi:MAG: hypothetical protein PUB52_11580 [Lachnospiraceae bacterium]|nr:hypothetical protein [Lachnospiraceae bacterium]